MNKKEYNKIIQNLNDGVEIECDACNDYAKSIFIEDEKQYIYKCKNCHKEHIIDIPMPNNIQVNGISDVEISFTI